MFSGPPSDPGSFPQTRPRRNRRTEWARRLTTENVLTAADLIWPCFVTDTEAGPIEAMPGVDRYTVSQLVREVGRAAELGVPAVALFPHTDPALKTEDAAEAFNSDNLVCRAVRAIRAAGIDVGVICDVALDPYSSHGQDGLVRAGASGEPEVVNDPTLDALCEQAVVQAAAGCDVVAPSDMMDGRVGRIRAALDAGGFQHVQLLSYAAKYASAFYGPFRDAVGSGDALKGDKKTYQMNPANGDEALREVALDVAEGADMVMVKPGMPYLDVVAAVKRTFGVPTFAYQVSGEYAMLAGACDAGRLDRRTAVLESLLCFKRAGADGVLTYFAREAAEWLREG